VLVVLFVVPKDGRELVVVARPVVVFAVVWPELARRKE
jgi:hypothetical protein